MASATALARRPTADLLWVLLPLLLLLSLPLAQPVRMCQSWNVNGARFKLRSYPALAGPVRINALGNYSACLSVTLNFSVSSLSSHLDPPIIQYLVILDEFSALTNVDSCEDTWAGNLQLFAGDDIGTDFWDDLLNFNQPTQRSYSYNGGWFQCCNSSERCNQVLNPPTFQTHATERPIKSCNGFNDRSGFTLSSSPLYVDQLSKVQGQFSECYSYTVQLTRGSRTLYYVRMDGYDPSLSDGTSSCMSWVNSTLETLKAENTFPQKLNMTMADSWGSCCNETNCNAVTLPPGSSTHILLPSPLHLTLISFWASMLILSLS